MAIIIPNLHTVYMYTYIFHSYIQKRQYPTWSETTDKDEKSGSGPRQQVLFFLDDFVAQQLELRDTRERDKLTHIHTHIQQSNTKQTDTHLSTGISKGVGSEGVVEEEEEEEEEMSATYNINKILIHRYVYIIESIISRVLLVILSILHIHTDTYTNIYQLHPTSIDNDSTNTSITTNTKSITTATIGIHKLTSTQKITIIQLLLLNRNYSLAIRIMTLFGYTASIEYLQEHLTTSAIVMSKGYNYDRCDDGCNIIDVTLRFSINTLNEVRLVSREGLAGTDRYTREQG